MKIASFRHSDFAGYGLIKDHGIVSISAHFKHRFPCLKDVLDANALGELGEDCNGRSIDYPIDDVQLLPPITNPSRIFCVGINYPKRYPLDNPVAPPANIILFAKIPGTLVGHGERLEIPEGEAADTFDYEGEVGIILGKTGRHIKESEALNYVAGYTIINDGSVRAWQKHSIHAGKNFASSGSCGPWMVTADEITDLAAMQLTTRLNGRIVQDTTVSKMLFSIPEIIAYISHTIDLHPGDLIATGSPEGAGGSQQPPRFLRRGDTLDFEVSGVGVLHNSVGQ